ncbi:dTMP kinase [Microvirga flavescens]|uniref:dTMP kinase n=1 Tax=Microvirga flavescens TaxID=2249811 RepID=UPI000DD934EF|nr:dTMP kinase [Microvirga flavescens]
MTGYFITFEGGEGAGKSTQINRLRQRLAQQGQSVLVTREPGGSPRAEEIRTFLLSGQAKPFGAFAEALLFYAARLDHLDQTIRPALLKGTHVLCDRFSDSTRAYQGASGNVDKRLIEGVERVVVADNKPDLTLILDLPVDVGLQRAGVRREGAGEGVDRFEGEGLSFHEKLRQAYLDIAASEPKRCVVIDANRSPDDVEASIWHAVQTRLPLLAVNAKDAQPHGA